MSTLSSQISRFGQLVSQNDLLRLIVDGRKPPQRAFRQTGLDVELLDRIYKFYRPGFDYIQGYRPFEKYFDEQGTLQAAWMRESGLTGRYPYVLRIAVLGFRRPSGQTALPLFESEIGRYGAERKEVAWLGRETRLQIFLTRKGEWIVWTNYPENRFEVIWKSNEELITFVTSLVPDGASLIQYDDHWNYKYQVSQSLALYLVARLSDAFEASIETKKQRLSYDEEALAKARRILDTVADH